MSERRPRRVLIIVQNLSVPFDRRVWLECRALVDAGYGVSVICPKGKGDPKFHVIDGVRLYKYRAAAATDGVIAFAWEFAYSFLATLWLTFKVARRDGFDAIQACNPPDTFFPIGWFFKRFGKKYVFDQHDLCPELFESRFPEGRSALLRALRLLESGTYATADAVISTNESYRSVALGRGGKDPDEVTVVRTGPDPDWLRRGPAVPEHRRGRDHLVTYIGVMGPQDGVDIAVRAAAHVVRDHGRDDIAFTFIGRGDCFDELVQLADDLGVSDAVHFTGRAPDELVAELMSTAVLGLSPDPKNPLNDVSTMNKTMEYMAYELPVVAFDLVETRVSAADAAVYVEPNDEERYAKAIIELVDNPTQRAEMGRYGRARVEDVLAWSHQARSYVGVYDRLVGPAVG